MIFTRFAARLYFLAIRAQISGCVHSISWSIALPISCSNHHLSARDASAPSSFASASAIYATSFECVSMFCP